MKKIPRGTKQQLRNVATGHAKCSVCGRYDMKYLNNKYVCKTCGHKERG